MSDTSDRTKRIISLLTEHIANFIATEANANPLITVTNLTISADYKNATVYVSILPDDRQKDALIFLKRHGSALRKHLKQKINLKSIPNLEFALDANEQNRQQIDQLIHQTRTKD